MLYLVASPIGNLSDITLRALEALRSADYILCEDTRHSGILLAHYNIQKPKVSYHKFNEASRQNKILEDLKAGMTIAFLSDAGSPGIADPGQKLVEMAKREKLAYTVLPGACALIAAVGLSGWDLESFQFLGFLSKQGGPAKKQLSQALEYPGISIIYESPHKICRTLELLQELAPERKLFIAREISKLFEEGLEGTARILLAHFEERTPKGEFVLLLDKASQDQTSTFLPSKIKELQEEFGLSLKEAIAIAAKIFPDSKKAMYKQMHAEIN